MKSLCVYLNTIEKIKRFVDTMTGIEGETTLYSGKYVINAKSIMGIMSLDLSKPMKLEIEDWKDEYSLLIKDYVYAV